MRVLLQVYRGDFASAALDSALNKASLSSRDAGLATHIVYGVLRYKPSLEAALDPMLQGNTPLKARVLLMAGLFEKVYLDTPLHAVVNEYVNLARLGRLAAPALVNAVLRRVGSAVAPMRSNYPEWLAEAIEQLEQGEEVLGDMLKPQPLWLYTTLRGESALVLDGVRLTGMVLGVHKVELGGVPLAKTRAYKKGDVQPVNPASMACVEALGDVSNRTVLDLAGGSGVKAALLAARGAKVISVDKAAHKHELAASNMKRLGVSAKFISHDLTKPLDEQAELVLLDAPCTGTGTLRAHPEIKYRLSPETVVKMSELQRKMLAQAAACTRVGGLLVYSVCSLLPEEGVKVIDDFLENNADWVAEDLEFPFPVQRQGAGVLTLPLEGIDGFYIARLRKKSESVSL